MSMAQQHCNFTTNCHQVSAEARVKENEDNVVISPYKDDDPCAFQC
jgi:hypothetical protein